jgi:RNA polymerase sigma-70 factor, ECF subfamily
MDRDTPPVQLKDKDHLKLLVGNERYYWNIWKLFERKVFNYCLYRLYLTPHDAEDLCSETMLKAYDKLPNADQDTNILAWLLRICKNMYFDLMRRQSVNLKYQLTIDEPTTDMDESYRRELTVSMLLYITKTIEKIPGNAGLMSKEYFIEGKTYRKISEENDCTEAYVRKQIFNVRRCLAPACNRYMNSG